MVERCCSRFHCQPVLSLSSCGHSQQLVGITIQPESETFGASNIPVIANAGAQLQLRALGTYIHPPVTKDITSQVTWTSNAPQMVTVNSAGVITVTGGACGAALISATVTTNNSSGGVSSSGALVTGFMTANVVCFTASGGGARVARSNGDLRGERIGNSHEFADEFELLQSYGMSWPVRQRQYGNANCCPQCRIGFWELGILRHAE